MPQSRPRKDKGSPGTARSDPANGRGDLQVVGIGASAGGLDACGKLLDALPAHNGMAFILVQHLDPTHQSMLVDLLTGHTEMTVRQAAEGTPLEADHLYIIPPGAYLSVEAGALRLSQPEARHGARLPFDFLLNSLAETFGPRAIAVILSGTGGDGSLGLTAVKKMGGFVIAQEPSETAYDGMPRSAIGTGAVDLVAPVAKIAEALVKRAGHASVEPASIAPPADRGGDWLSEIIDILRAKAGHDFALYKRGTLERRIERRMAMAEIKAGETQRYVELLRRDAGELDLLAKDLLINVTSFFRDPPVFAVLADRIIPDLLRGHSHDHPIRIWVPGCSTGEEAYSLAMLFLEQIAAARRDIKLQIFASDVDADAVATARQGLYPGTMAAEVSAARRSRFFSKEADGYRVSPDLRAAVVFTVQDVLTDPPFSRLDMVSCRNLLIYLEAEAQAKVISMFHFALREGGILLLGDSETAGSPEGRFELIFKSERIYKRIGRGRTADLEFAGPAGAAADVPAPTDLGRPLPREARLAELSRRLLIESHAPAAVLTNRNHEYLYSLGPIDRYLRVAPGHPSHDLLTMAREGLRTKLRSAIQRAGQENARIVVAGGRSDHGGDAVRFDIDVQPVSSDGESLFLVCFVDAPIREGKSGRTAKARDPARVGELEQELQATRAELQSAIRSLELSNEDQKAINEEALSVQEEYQSTNEELLTSKEELQSLNEELTALNGQLQETLEKQRTTANDLQNVLYSTDLATLFLDTNLNIRFFTPATRSLFRVIPSDLGRPLADLNSLAVDAALLSDAKTVLQTLTPIEREIEAKTGAWYIRSILPYRTQDDRIEGVVITFRDITEQRRAADALGVAKRQAELANVAKSRFLAAASHDLRQPLQTLALLQGLLAKAVEGERAKQLVARLDETLGAMSGMLNTLLDINQIEAGTVSVDMVNFPISDLLDRLGDEFAYHAQAKKIDLRVVSSSMSIRSDPRLLEQMIRNLLSNALKYTQDGKVLLGCRRRERVLSVEVWDTGVGIASEELQAIFEEYHQVKNASGERGRGLGLGLSIVQQLGDLLGHRVRVRSRPGKGSVFAIEVMLPAAEAGVRRRGEPRAAEDAIAVTGVRTGSILIIEDEPEVRQLLELLLKNEGHHTVSASDAAEALDLAARGVVRPDIILADFNLPHGMDGLELSSALRERLHRQIPVVILTGDISTSALRAIAGQDCLRLDKPVKAKELAQVIHRLLPPSPSRQRGPKAADSAVIFVVDDDSHVREAIRTLLEEEGLAVVDFASGEAFLEARPPEGGACLLIDAYLPGMSGLQLLERLQAAGRRLPAIMITGGSDVSVAVQAMRAGASDFIEKPFGRGELLASIEHALEQSRDSSKASAWRAAAAKHIAALTARERQVMSLVLAGHPSKNIAADLGISQRTVENHRAAVMKKTGSKSLPALARLALAAAGDGDGDGEDAPAFNGTPSSGPPGGVPRSASESVQ